MNNPVFFTILVFPLLTFAQTGKVYDNLSMTSEILNMERKYSIYLPPDYETSERSYPVLYLLHGAGNDHTAWIQMGEVLSITDQAIKNGTATAMIVVMPDASAGQGGYTNGPGDWDYEDFFFEEFIPHVEKAFRIKQRKRYRAVSGLSMGGGGAFYYALHRPDLFSSACPLSATTGPAAREDTKRYMERRGKPDDSSEEMDIWFASYSVLEMVKTMPEKDLKSVKWYIDCGDDDFLFEGNSRVHIQLRKRKIPHEYRVRDGAHNWTYWRQSLPEVLSFVSKTFHGH